MRKFKLALLNKNLALLNFLVNPDDDFEMDNVRTNVEESESDDEMENLAPPPKRGRGRGSRGKQSPNFSNLKPSYFKKVTFLRTELFIQYLILFRGSLSYGG